MPRVVVIGGANVDVKGRSAAPVIAGTSNPGSVVTAVGGVGRNIADNLARLGVDVALIAAIGDDANGRFIATETAKAGVDVSCLETVPAPSGIYLAMLDERGELLGAINDMHCVDLLSVAVLERHKVQLLTAELIVADCNLPVSCLAWLVGLAKAEGRRLLIEPVSVPKAMKLLELGMLPEAFIMTPNAAQLEALGNAVDHRTALARLHGYGIANIVLHRGRDGALVSESDGSVEAIPSLAEHAPRDVTGAGDAAVAGLVCGLIEGLDIAEAARLGQAAAAIKLRSPESVATALNRDSVRALAGC